MLEKLAKQTAIYGISTILGRMLSYLLTPFYTRIFGVESYGIITDVYALIPFALVVLTMGMESSYFRFAAKAEAEGGDVAQSKRKLFATTWGVTSLASLLFFAVVAIFRNEASALMGADYVQNPLYVVSVAAIVMMDVMACIPFARLREQGKAMTFVLLKLFNIILQVGLAFAFWGVGLFESDFGVGWAFVANLLASVVTLVAVLVASGRISLRIDKALLLVIFAYSLPLLLSGIAGTANEFIDRQLIKYLVPEESMAQLGIYGAITKIAVVMTLFTQMYRLAAEPFFLANYRKEEFVAMNAAALKYFVMVSMFIFLGIALYRDVFALIVGRDFREGIHILPVVLGANILSGVWLNLSFWYKREEKTKFALWITLTGLVASVGFGFLLIPQLGYYGAAWSRFAAEVVMVAVSIVLNRIFYPTPYQFGRMAEYIALALAIFFVSEWVELPNELLHYTLSTLFIVLYLAYAVWREKIDVVAMLKHFLRRGKR
ncbi:MAG: oligosaccharide flippase family protein [Alistipes sp.]|nr:oligosaccharide flippase family protein [Alistipes sp.]